MKWIVFTHAVAAVGLSFLLTGCARNVTAKNSPPEESAVEVEHELDASLVRVDHPERFPLVTVSHHATALELSVTGVVSVDVSRSVPVVSMSSGRIVEIGARL